ncbi:hypothetical protein KEM48_010585 [Puccinia striiformis f. sp. tritici PST-130]|nr:hypothetical protein KEM48_010585 [Puccinia striiformis f. sp. tritici PST-130]
MKLAMLTNQTNSSPDRNPKMGNYHYLSYRQSCPEVVVHEDGNFDRHPSRLKRVRVHEEERRSEERGRDKQLEMDSRWSNLQPGRGQAIDRSRINHQPEEMEEEEEDGEGSPWADLIPPSTPPLPANDTRPDPASPLLMVERIERIERMVNPNGHQRDRTALGHRETGRDIFEWARKRYYQHFSPSDSRLSPPARLMAQLSATPRAAATRVEAAFALHL